MKERWQRVKNNNIIQSVTNISNKIFNRSITNTINTSSNMNTTTTYGIIVTNGHSGKCDIEVRRLPTDDWKAHAKSTVSIKVPVENTTEVDSRICTFFGGEKEEGLKYPEGSWQFTNVFLNQVLNFMTYLEHFTQEYKRAISPSLYCATFDSTNTDIAAGLSDGSVVIYNTKDDSMNTLKCNETREGTSATAIAFYPDKRIAALLTDVKTLDQYIVIYSASDDQWEYGRCIVCAPLDTKINNLWYDSDTRCIIAVGVRGESFRAILTEGDIESGRSIDLRYVACINSTFTDGGEVDTMNEKALSTCNERFSNSIVDTDGKWTRVAPPEKTASTHNINPLIIDTDWSTTHIFEEHESIDFVESYWSDDTSSDDNGMENDTPYDKICRAVSIYSPTTDEFNSRCAMESDEDTDDFMRNIV